MIYFLRQGITPYIKIGYTCDKVDSRVKALQCGTADRLGVIGTCEGTIYMEKKLHRHFREKRINGEWFLEDQELAGAIERLIAGTFDWAQTRRIKGTDKRRKREPHTVEDISYAHPAWHETLKIVMGEGEYRQYMRSLPASFVWPTDRPNWKANMRIMESRGIPWHGLDTNKNPGG